jgi:hypothetical protein
MTKRFERSDGAATLRRLAGIGTLAALVLLLIATVTQT